MGERADNQTGSQSGSLWKFLRRARFSWIDLVIISIIGSILKVAILDHLHLGWH